MKKTLPDKAGLENTPGYYIRRLQQIAVAIFLQETEGFGLTPVQYAALETIGSFSKIDQRSLARQIGQDTSTIGGVIDRLESRGLVLRNPSENDRRVHLLTLTNEGKNTLQKVSPAVKKAQELILTPLNSKDQIEFMRMLKILVNQNNELSRAPRITQ